MRKNNYRFSKPKDIRVFMSSVINDYNNGAITDTKAKTLGYLSEKMLKVMEVCDLEEQIEELQKLAGKE